MSTAAAGGIITGRRRRRRRLPVGKHISDYMSEAYSLSGNRRVITGVITLEDVLEAVIKDEIVDETDNYVDVNNALTSVRGRGPRVADPDQLPDAVRAQDPRPGQAQESETNAIVAFLSLNVAEFKKLARFGACCRKLIVASSVEEIEEERPREQQVPRHALRRRGRRPRERGHPQGAAAHQLLAPALALADTPSRSNSMTRRGSSGQIDFLATTATPTTV